MAPQNAKQLRVWVFYYEPKRLRSQGLYKLVEGPGLVETYPSIVDTDRRGFTVRTFNPDDPSYQTFKKLPGKLGLPENM